MSNHFIHRLIGAVTISATGLSSAACAQTASRAAPEPNPWIEVRPMPDSPHPEHAAKKIVLISGDEEYRSEEALPQLARILACRNGFTCTVLFAIDPETGEINPDHGSNIPGLEALADADLMIIATRFRNLPDEQMKHVDDYVKSGRPIIGLRTATHAFNLGEHSSYRHYSWNFASEHHAEWNGGFGKHILGETWVAHHGDHGKQSTRGLVANGAQTHPIARGLAEQQPWGPTDVYLVNLPLVNDATPIVLGQTLDGMMPDAEPAEGAKNSPMIPVAWTREMELPHGHTRRVFTTTMGAATDLEAAGTRTMLINAVYWALGLEGEIPAGGCQSGLVGEYSPTAFGFGGYVKGTRPEQIETGCE